MRGVHHCAPGIPCKGNTCHRQYLEGALRLTGFQSKIVDISVSIHNKNAFMCSNRDCVASSHASGQAILTKEQLGQSSTYPETYYDSEGRLMIKNLTKNELVNFCRDILGEVAPEKRAFQLWRWVYSDFCWLKHIDDAPAETVQNGFSKSFREKFNRVATLDGGVMLVEERTALDGTVKLVFELTSPGPGKGGRVETVLIPVVREQGSKERITLCVSSQVGCAMGCKFCYTGTMGLLGNLTVSHIVEQVIAARRYHYDVFRSLHNNKNLVSMPYATPITNIVYMGMGEPLDNLDAVIGSIDIVLDHHGLHFSHNKVTVSTVGLVPQMKTLLNNTKVALALSLHGATDEVRRQIVPVNNRYCLEDLVGVLEEYFPYEDKNAPHVLIEYTMMDGINDGPKDAESLLALLQGVKCKINLIVFNPHEGTIYRASTQQNVENFRDILIKGGRVVTVRASRGEDSMAACGQLGGGKNAREQRNAS
jgi:23S rRNA (adenine2503-C2)-methyltransferase